MNPNDVETAEYHLTIFAGMVARDTDFMAESRRVDRVSPRSNHIPSSPFFGQFRVPDRVISKHRVKDRKEFPEHRDDGDSVVKSM